MARSPYSQKYAERTFKALDNLKRVEAECNAKYPRLIAEELDEIGKEVVARWYADYDPVFYDRNRGLYKAYKITVIGTRIRADADASYMSEASAYNQDTELVYNIAFERGYHGGSYGREGNQRIIPYWRTPFPEYTSWGRPARKSFSIYEEMKAQMTKRAQELVDERNSKIDKATERVVRNLRALVNKGR